MIMVRKIEIDIFDSFFISHLFGNFVLKYGREKCMWSLLEVSKSGLHLHSGLSNNWFRTNKYRTLIVNKECDMV